MTTAPGAARQYCGELTPCSMEPPSACACSATELTPTKHGAKGVKQMTDQDNLRDKIADGVLRMHRIIGTTGRTGGVVCCSCDRTWRDHAQYQRHLAQAIIDTMTCPSCGTTWKERIDLPPGTEHLKCGNS